MANTVTIKVDLDDKGVVTGVSKVKSSLNEMGTAGQDAAKKTGDGFTVAKGIIANLATQGINIALNAIKDFASSVVEIGSGFETSMSKVSALSGATGDDLARLESKARELGSTTTFSASEAADALGYMALAGWDTEDMLEGVGSVLTLAQAGEMDLAAASDLVTDYLSAFNMTAADTGRMVDVLAYAQANANTTTAGLGESFKNCAANANAAGLDVETTTAAISMMANQGLKGSEAGTALNAVLRDMTAKMQDGAIAIGDQTVAVMDAEGNYRDFTDILADVEAATDGMGDAEKAAALQSTFTADSIKGLNLMLNAGSDEMVGFRDELYNCGGAAEETAAIMTDNLAGDMANLNSATEELGLKIYDYLQEPLRAVTQFITETVIPGLTWLVENFNVLGPIILGVATAVGVFTVAINMSTIITAVTNTLNMLRTAFSALTATMMANPFVLIASLIAGLVVAFMTLWNTSEEFRNFWQGVWDAIWGFIEPIVTAIGEGIQWLGEQFEWLQGPIEAVGGFFGGLADAAGAAWDFITGSSDEGSQEVSEDMASMQSSTEQAMSSMDATTTTSWAEISATTNSALTSMESDASSSWADIAASTNANLASMQSDTSSTMSSMESTTSSTMGAMESDVSSSYSGMSSDVSSYMSQMQSSTSSGMGSMDSSVASASGSMQSEISSAMNSMESNAGSSFNQMASSANSGLTEMSSTIQSCMSGAVQSMNDAVDKITNIWWWGIQDMTSNWNNANFSTPHVPLPHFSVSGHLDPNSNPPQVPSFSVNWYATGGIFNGASIIGVGEAGPEAVVPYTKKGLEPIADAVAEKINNAINVSINIERFENSSGQSIKELVDTLERELEKRIANKQRMLGIA